jgi:hypothetical protein
VHRLLLGHGSFGSADARLLNYELALVAFLVVSGLL